MNKGSWFLTWRGPSKVNAFDAGNKKMRKSGMIIERKNSLFTMNNKLAEGGLDVKLHLRGMREIFKNNEGFASFKCIGIPSASSFPV